MRYMCIEAVFRPFLVDALIKQKKYQIHFFSNYFLNYITWQLKLDSFKSA